ncbi:MAG: O-antigen ligase family protein [Armatimonadetes bacterium]|nr:O-antigen ligase family protein [Armatimonadota bacterium]
MSRKLAPSLAQTERDRLRVVQLGLIAVAVFLSPLVAAGLSHTHVPEISMQLLVLLSAIVWVVRSGRQGSIELPSKGLAGLAAALIMLGLVSLAKTVNMHVSLLDLVALICCVIVMLMIGSLRASRSAVYAVIGALLISAIIVGTIGIKERLLTTMPDWRVFSTFFNPDFLAGFVVLVLPVALAWYLSETSLGISLVAGLAVVLSLANLLLSGSRFGAAAAAVGLLVSLALALVSKAIRRPQLARLGVILIPCVLTVILVGGTLTNRMASVKAESHSGGFRVHTWRGTVRMVRAHPFTGTGLGTFEDAYPKYAEVGWTRLAHNSYLQLAAEGGVAMPLVLLVLIGTVVVPAAIGVRGRQDDAPSDWMPNRSLVISGLLGGTAASMARNMVDSDWYVAAIGTAFWLVLGASVALSDRDGVRFSMPVWRRWSKIGALGLIVVWLLSVLIAQAYYADGWKLLSSGERDDAVRAFRMAARFDPLNADLRRKLGGLLLHVGAESGDEALLRDAERQFKRATELESASAKSWYQLGKFYADGLHDDRRAVWALHAALDRDSHALHVLLPLAQAYERMGRHDDALRVYRRMADIEDSVYERLRAVPELVEPRYVIAREALAEDADRRGDSEETRIHYRIALDRVRRFRESVREMGPVMEQMGTRDPELESQIEAIGARIESRLTTTGDQSGSPARL